MSETYQAPTEENHLIELAAKGDSQAVREIVERHQAMVYGTCLRILGNEADAADAAQATFILFLKKCRKLKRDTVLGGWLYRTAGFVSRDFIRKSNRRKRREEQAEPLLWKIEGKGLPQPSYLFGIIHISKGPAVTLHPAAQMAFDASSHFYAEVPLDMASQMATMPLMMRKDGKKLDEAIGKDLAAELNAELKLINPALDSTPFQTMSTWIAAIFPQLLPHQLEGGKPLDLRLWDQATTAGKKTAGMEKPEAQLIAFTELTEAQQVILLAETLKSMKEERAEGKDTIKEVTDAPAGCCAMT